MLNNITNYKYGYLFQIIIDYYGESKIVEDIKAIMIELLFKDNQMALIVAPRQWNCRIPDIYFTIAERYKGRRFQLRQEVEQRTQNLNVLVAHTYLMIHENHRMQGFLWRVKYGHRQSLSSAITLERRAYLLGTCHKSYFSNEHASTSFLHPKVIETLNKAQKVCVECNILDPEIYRRMLIRKVMYIRVELDRRNEISKENLTKIDQMVIEAGSDKYLCMDIEVILSAEKSQKPIISLESPEDQVDFEYQEPPNEPSLNISDQTLECIDLIQYSHYDPMQFAQLTFNDKNMQKRNLNMARDILDRLQVYEDITFYAIGAFHFFGNEGILALLQRYGSNIEIERII